MYEQCTGSTVETVFPQLDSQLVVMNAKLISQLKKEINDYPEHVCWAVNSCTKGNLSHEWTLLTTLAVRFGKLYLQQNPSVGDMFMCKYCKPLIMNNKLPAHCVPNGLQLDPAPPELAKLNILKKQLIQWAKWLIRQLLGWEHAQVKYQCIIPLKPVRVPCFFFHCHWIKHLRPLTRYSLLAMWRLLCHIQVECCKHCNTNIEANKLAICCICWRGSYKGYRSCEEC